jgi:hypothetical protein
VAALVEVSMVFMDPAATVYAALAAEDMAHLRLLVELTMVSIMAVEDTAPLSLVVELPTVQAMAAWASVGAVQQVAVIVAAAPGSTVEVVGQVLVEGEGRVIQQEQLLTIWPIAIQMERVV